jgi:hypothetical protein
MSKPMVRIHNTETDEVIDREMNDAEYKIYLEEQELTKKYKEDYQKSVAAKQALLEKLGITEDEAKLLLA